MAVATLFGHLKLGITRLTRLRKLETIGDDGMKFGWDLQTGLNRSMISSRSSNNPSSGDYLYYLDIHGLPQFMMRRRSDSVLTYRSGPWNGLRLSDVPEMKFYNMFHFELVQN
ncbi:S-locus-specific glycoprotein S13 [Acorus calamus]|uniref:S-locus-specific glycoprotein S13 n=1 Tax=Acorus calamus TaxID=4465 RepID=A0AAV9DRF3_ACOCL|nr:S-locus-specific glycoprotein S13 [Acorus calamus]